MNHFTENVTVGLGENLLKSLKGISLGISLVIGSIYLFSYNEHRSINQTLALEEMQENIIIVDKPIYKADYENKPILISGDIEPIHPLEDDIFNVKSNGLMLERKVEMYQWVEHVSSTETKEIGGSTEITKSYDYKEEWSSSFNDSSSFKYPAKHYNPEMKYTQKIFTTDANLGEFYLANYIVKELSNSTPYTGLSKMPEKILDMSNHHTYLYKGSNSSSPEIGDLKISFMETQKGLYTLAGMTRGKNFGYYQSTNDRNLLFTRVGKVQSSIIFEEEFRSNVILTWVFRGIGFILMYLGFMLIMGLIVAISNIIPIFGSLLEGALGLIAGIMTLALGSLVIAISWFASRPMLSFIILGVGIGLALLVNFYKSRKKV